jgi:hypothetical protein
MTSLLFIVLGIVLNSAGLLLFGEAVIHRAMAAGAAAAGFGDSVLALLLINAGICLIVLGLRRGGRL